MIRASLAALLACSALASPAWALQVPTPDDPNEPRVLSVPFKQDGLYQIIVPAQGQTLVTLSPDETKFSSVVAAPGWRKDTAQNTILFVPSPGAPTTVAHIVTDLPDGTSRRYAFELTAAADGVKPTHLPGSAQVASNDPAVGTPAAHPTPYVSVRLTYAQEETRAKAKADAERKAAAAAAWRARRASALELKGDAQARVVLANAAAAQRRRCNFMWRGDASVLPMAACDTGAATSFLWPGQMPIAAVFLVGADGSEQSVTQAPSPERPGLVVIPTTSQFWRIRRGSAVADLYNVSFDPLAVDTGTNTISPRVRTRLRADAGMAMR